MVRAEVSRPENHSLRDWLLKAKDFGRTLMYVMARLSVTNGEEVGKIMTSGILLDKSKN